MAAKVIIQDRAFWRLYDDGRMVRIYANERIRAHLSQVRSVEVRMANEESPKRTTNPPRPPGTMPTLPAADRDIGDKTLTELAFDHGYGSVYRFSEALRKHRRAIYDAARANGRERANANLMTPTHQAQL
jgi:hypothetical protein